jgi:amidase
MMLRIVLLTAVLTGCASTAAVAADATKPAPAASGDGPAYLPLIVAQQRMRAGTLTSLDLTRHFIARIATLDHAGPNVNSVIELNPDALGIARKRDAQRAAGMHGALLGVPVLLKDNIDTGDGMLTSAGSLALATIPAPRDATIVSKLREAGAVILGKTNLSEWANFRSTHASSGWSARGGQTRNPYVLDRNPCGSSAGSGAAVAADFATLAIGTETDGSIICPATMNGVVGIKPTLGLVSRAGIVPISHSQDTAGPMARSVADAAAMLTVIAGSDPRDPATAEADAHKTDYTQYLDPDGLKGKRIGVVRQFAGAEPNADRMLDQAIVVMKAAGAVIVDPVELPHAGELGKPETTVLLYDFKHDIAAYLAGRPKVGPKTLADLIAFDDAHRAEEMPWFGQELFLEAEAKGPLSDQAYTDALEKAKRLAGPEGIDAALARDRLDALLSPSWGPAFVTDPVLGDHIVSGDPTVGGASQPAAVAGYPSIAVPAGYAHGLPVGIVFFGAKWSEPTLIAIAYGFEQHTHAFTPPRFLATAPVTDARTDVLGVAAAPAAGASAPAPAASSPVPASTASAPAAATSSP